MMTKKTILIVDDEPNVLKALKRLLMDTDYDVLTAESGEAGLKLFEQHKIRLVISDYRMPGMTGVEFLSKVKERFPDTIRIILSGYADVAAIVDAINNGHVYKFIAKPWNDQEFLTTIMRSFDQYQLAQENFALNSELQIKNKELLELTASLEEKIKLRTADLEMKNRALTIAQNILNLLPVGVIGIDSETTVVYMNDSLQHYLDTESLGLGRSAVDAMDEMLVTVMARALKEQSMQTAVVGLDQKVGLICTPLPRGEGVIGLFCRLGHPEEYKALQDGKSVSREV
jgi:two-component system NtrC family sensor kinase